MTPEAISQLQAENAALKNQVRILEENLRWSYGRQPQVRQHWPANQPGDPWFYGFHGHWHGKFSTRAEAGKCLDEARAACHPVPDCYTKRIQL